MITSIWSAYGHTFIGDGEYDSCLTCGAMYELVADPSDPTRGDYRAANGDEPTQCTHDTSMGHGEDAADDSDCNCHLCS